MLADLYDDVLTTVLTYLEFLRANMDIHEYCTMMPPIKVWGVARGDTRSAAVLATQGAGSSRSALSAHLPIHAPTHPPTTWSPQALLEDYGVRLDVAMTAYRPVLQALEQQAPSMAEDGEAAAAPTNGAAHSDAEMEEGEAEGGGATPTGAGPDAAGPGATGRTWAGLLDDVGGAALPGVPTHLSPELIATFWGLSLPDIMFPAQRWARGANTGGVFGTAACRPRLFGGHAALPGQRRCLLQPRRSTFSPPTRYDALIERVTREIGFHEKALLEVRDDISRATRDLEVAAARSGGPGMGGGGGGWGCAGSLRALVGATGLRLPWWHQPGSLTSGCIPGTTSCSVLRQLMCWKWLSMCVGAAK